MALKVGVFGGNGFVGSTVMRGLITKGHSAMSFARTGGVPVQFRSQEWAKACTWKAADAFQRSTYENDLSGLDAVVISVGSPPVPTLNQAAYEAQRRANGQTCVEVIEAAKGAGVKQVVLVNASIPSWAPAGYREGKKMAEESAKAFVEESEAHGATILYPSGIFGTRYTKGGAGIPLTPFLWPASVVMTGFERLGGNAAIDAVFPGASVKPPISVGHVAAAAILGATDLSFRGKLYGFNVNEMAALDPVL